MPDRQPHRKIAPFRLSGVSPMWFRQLALFRLPPDARPDLAKLEAGMEQHCFAPPSGLEWSSQGFVAPAGHAPDRLLHPLAGGAPGDAQARGQGVAGSGDPRRAGKQSCRHRGARSPSGRPQGKARTEEQVTDDLLPRAFTKTGRTRCWTCRPAGFWWMPPGRRRSPGQRPARSPAAVSGPPAAYAAVAWQRHDRLAGWRSAGRL